MTKTLTELVQLLLRPVGVSFQPNLNKDILKGSVIGYLREH